MKKIFFILLLLFPINTYSIVYPITPKYVSIKKNKAFLRNYPSFESDIKFIYQKKNFPILIVDEHENWRKTIDVDGIDGWIHISMLSNRKTFINKKKQNLIKYKQNKDIITAIVEYGVVGKIIKCEIDLCKVKINAYRGWLEKKYLWGIKKD